MGIIDKIIALRQKSRAQVSSTSIERAFHVNLQDVYDLHDLVESWKDVYLGIPEWVGGDKTQVKDSLNVASMIVGDIATKCVSELSLESHSKDMKDFFQKEIKMQIREQLEYALAMGAVAVRPYLDVEGKIRLAWYSADRFIPTQWDGNRCVGGIFFEQTEQIEDGVTIFYTKLEMHEWLFSGVRVSVKLFRSKTSGDLGEEVSLSRVKKWENLDAEFENVNCKHPLFCYIKTPFANNKALGNKTGVSIYKDAIGTLEAVDRTWDNLKWELESATARIFIEEDAIPMEIDRKGNRRINLNAKDLKMFTVLDSHEGKGIIDVYAPPIRQADIVATLKLHLSMLCASMHLDSGAYVYDDSKQMVTATEISTKEQKTYQTITDIQKWTIEPSIKYILEAVNEMSGIFHLDKFSTENYSLSFGDSILHDEQSMKITAQQEVQYGLRSTKSYLMEYRHLSEEEADKEIEALKKETEWKQPKKQETQNPEDGTKVRDGLNPEHKVDDIKSQSKQRDSK